MIRTFVLAVSLALGWYSSQVLAELPVKANQIKELSWDDLVPRDAQGAAQASTIDHGGGVDQAVDPLTSLLNASEAPVVSSLDQNWVKLPGFIVPLELDDAKGITEFLLVPYFGACIHVPPPPSNQIVHVKMPQGVGEMDIYFPFWIVGQLSVSSAKTELALAGYSMTGYQIEPFE